MPDPAELAAVFVAASSPPEAPEDLGDRLLALAVAARAAHPEVRSRLDLSLSSAFPEGT
jgi:hypothetical protein